MLLLSLFLPVARVSAQRSDFQLLPAAGDTDPGVVVALAQDDDGFLWVGAQAGLLRFDGRSWQYWAAAVIDRPVVGLAHPTQGRVLARTRDGRVFAVTGRGAEPEDGPEGRALHDVRDVAFDATGRVWCVIGSTLWWREAAGQWTRLPAGRLDGDTPLRLRTLADGLGLVTDRGAWVLRDPGHVERLMREPGLLTIAGGGGRPYALVSQYAPWLWLQTAQGGFARRARPSGRAMDMRYRGNTLWLALDHFLLAYEPDGRVRQHDTTTSLPSGGPLLVDREGSLWLGTFVGLVQFPEPDTWHWDQHEGLPGLHAFHLLQANGVLWVSTFRGLARFAPDLTQARVVQQPSVQGIPCVDGDGVLWVSDGQSYWRWRDGNFRAAPPPAAPPGAIATCLRDDDGALWLAGEGGAFRLARGADAPRRVTLADLGEGIELLWRGEGGTLWASDGERACEYRDPAVALRCADLPYPSHVAAWPRGGGHYWIGGSLGLMDFDGRGVRLIAGDRRDGGGLRDVVAPARAGGAWAVGLSGSLVRVQPSADGVTAWRAVERIGPWMGVPALSAAAVLESPSGDLWLAGNRGVFRVPPSARAAAPVAPAVIPVALRVDGDERGLDETLDLAAGDHDLRLEFAAMSLRDRSRLRFRSRLGSAVDWSEPTREPVLNLVGLPPGNYRAEMSASLDGRNWSSAPAAVTWQIAAPWYRQGWVRALFALAALGVLTLLYRLRVASLLRLERERSRIAMDLHDDLGAGLGAIGMLAGVAARSGASAEERRRLAEQIAENASLLGGGLRSLVWAMRSGRAGLRDLALQLVDHARRLFPAETPVLSVSLPEAFPSGTLRPEVRRHVLLIALEALHNAGRHADAGHVRLEMVCTPRLCTLRIADDGRGFDATAPGSGSGLENMRRRAAWIGAELALRAQPGEGTCLELRFRPFAERASRMIMPWRQRRAPRRLPP